LESKKSVEKANVFEIFLGGFSKGKDENLFDLALAEKP
jgi:hypothetical protein